MPTYPRGIDSSNHQGAIHWEQVAASGVQFAICKASEGVDYLDSWFTHNWSECSRLNIARGAYHYGLPSQNAPESEAAFFREVVGSLATGDVLALDLEDPDAYGDLSGWAYTFVRSLENLVGFKPIVYTSPSYANEHGLYNERRLGDYGLWL